MASENVTIVFATFASLVKEEFDDVAVKRDSGVMEANGAVSYHKLEKRSRGWYATIANLGIRVWLGDVPIPGIVTGCDVELRIIPKVKEE